VWYEAEGEADLEWFSRSSDGQRWVLLNDNHDAEALKAYRTWNLTPLEEVARPQIKTLLLGGAILRIEHTGVLQVADQVSGPWKDLPTAASPYLTPINGAVQNFWRTYMP
jgi:hypothetical protein